MDHARSDDWVARVVAWHNRHPLARRIVPAMVSSLGYVELPFVAGEATSRQRWRAAFSEKFLPPFGPRRIARWALRHGQEGAPAASADPALPVRRVLVDPARSDSAPKHLWLATAAIDCGPAQRRVLLDAGPTAAVLGRRLWSRRRLAAGTLAMLLLLALPVLRQLRPAAPDSEDEPEAALAMAPAPPPPLPAAPVEPARKPTPPPADAEVRHGRVELPVLRPALDVEAKAAAREAVAAARAVNAPPPTEVYAVAMRPVRTQAESELMLAALKAAVTQAGPPAGLRLDALPAGDDWRAVCWPFRNREDAERFRDRLVMRGQVFDIVAF